MDPRRRPTCQPISPSYPDGVRYWRPEQTQGSRRAAPAFPPGLELLKLNLLNRALRTFCEPHFERPLRRAAEQAARLAMGAGYPMLVFPELFAELAIPAMVEAEYRLRGGFHFASRFQP